MKKSKVNFKVLFENDNFLWLFSFLFAFMLWFMVVSTINTSADRTIAEVPVTFNTAGTSLEALGLDAVLSEPLTARVDISGERSVVADVQREDILLTADLTGVTAAGEYSIRLSAADRLGRGFDVTGVHPREVKVRFDRTVTKTFPVTVDLSRLTYPDGYVIGDEYVNVQNITISGPESDVSRVVSCVARAQKAGGITKTEVLDAPLLLLDADGNEVTGEYMELSSQSAAITVPLLKTKRLPITVGFLNVPDGFPLKELKYRLSKEDILIAGPESSISSMTELNVGYIDFRDMDGGDFNFNLTLPAGYMNLEGDESITVSFDTTGLDSEVHTVTNIRLVNVPAGYEVSPITTSIRNVRVYGSADELAALTAADLVAEVDLSSGDLSAGSSSVIANLYAPNRGLVWCSGTYRVQISVKEKGN